MKVSPAPPRAVARLAVLVSLAALAVQGALAAGPAAAQTPPGPFAPPPVTIHSDGPLTSIVNTRRFQCQVTYDNDGQYFPPGSQFGQCGTYIALNDTLYGPAFGPGLPAGLTPATPNTAWSQPGVTGTGTAADPFTNKTTTLLPGTDVIVRENVRYVTGENFYRADIIVQNQGTGDISFRAYHAADCHLVSGGTFGLGYGVQRDDGSGLTTVGCATNPNNTPAAGWVQSLIPLTGPNGFQQGYYVNVWGRVANRRPLTDFAFVDVQWDPAIALSWDDTLPAGGSATYSYMAAFSPSGAIPPNPLTPLPLPPDEPPPGTPDPPNPGPVPSPPRLPTNVTLPGTVFVRATAGVLGIRARCRATGSKKRRGCVIETRRGGTRRTFVLNARSIARLRQVLSASQRNQLRRDCETALTVRAVVYQPPGRRARVVRKVIRVLCARLQSAQCSSVSRTFATSALLASPVAGLSRREDAPVARAAC